MWWYCINFLVLYVYRACRLKKKAQHEANKVKLQGLEMEQRKFFSMWILLSWGYSGFQVKRMVKELFLGGLNFPIREFLGRKIWQGIGIFNRWLDLSKFFLPQIHGSACMFRVVILHYYCYCWNWRCSWVSRWCGKDNFRCVTNKQTQIISDLFNAFQKFLRLRNSAWFFWWG